MWVALVLLTSTLVGIFALTVLSPVVRWADAHGLLPDAAPAVTAPSVPGRPVLRPVVNR